MSVIRSHGVCPVCSFPVVNLLYRVDGFDIDRCRGCALAFVRQRLTDEELAPYYQSSDVVYEDASNVENLGFYFLRLKNLIERCLPAPHRLLDVGCSRGQFLDQLNGWDVHGIELSESDASFARQRHGSRIHQGTLADYPDPVQPFDVITLLDAFDHMPEPRQVLARCRDLLRSGGGLVIKVHDISCLFAKLTRRHFYAILPPYHLFYYSEHTLRLLLESSGFRVVLARHIGHRLFLKTIPYRLARGKASGFFWWFYKLLDKTPLGRIPIYKNLNDIITVIAVRDDDAPSVVPRVGG